MSNIYRMESDHDEQQLVEDGIIWYLSMLPTDSLVAYTEKQLIKAGDPFPTPSSPAYWSPRMLHMTLLWREVEDIRRGARGQA